MSELEMYMPGKVTQFLRHADEPMVDQPLLVEVTATDSGDIELAWDMPRTATRVYLRVPQDQLLRIITDSEPTPA